MSDTGFGTPGVHCPLPSYGADQAELSEEIYGAMVAHAQGRLSNEEFAGLIKNLRIKLKQKKIDRIVGKLETLWRQEKEDKARKKAEKLAKVVNKIQSIDPSYDPDLKVKAWMLYADGSISNPIAYVENGGAMGDAIEDGDISIFETARAINDPTLVYAPTTRVVRRPVRRAPPRPKLARHLRRRPSPPRHPKAHGPRPGAKARARARYGEAYLGPDAFVEEIGLGASTGLSRDDLFGYIDRMDLFEEDYGGIFSRDRAGSIASVEKKMARLERKRQRKLDKAKSRSEIYKIEEDFAADMAILEEDLEQLQGASALARLAATSESHRRTIGGLPERESETDLARGDDLED